MNDSELDRLMQSAQANVTPPDGFQREVWMRIEAAESDAAKPRLSMIAERFFNWLALPPVALAACSVMLAAGVWAGLESANPAPQGEITYIQSISPFGHIHGR